MDASELPTARIRAPLRRWRAGRKAAAALPTTTFRRGRRLVGKVTARSGRRLTGRLVYDLDESETTEPLDAPEIPRLA